MRILLGMANANIEADLRSLLEEIEDADVIGVAPSSTELLDYVDRLDPDLVFIHENLGPEPALQTIRDIGLRFPSVGILQISPDRSPSTVIRAMEAGARGVVSHPFAFDDLSSKVTNTREWSRQMRQVLAGAIAQATSTRGKIYAFVGAKGGVGTTTLATHLALDHLVNQPREKVCLVDLDLEKGDVSAVLEVRQAVSIADLAKVHQDLSATTVRDAIVQHDCGLNLLLTPADIRMVEVITPEALRSIFALLRREFDVIVVDAGGSVSPSQASIVEAADEVIVVTSSDVLAVRAMRKRILAWESLGVASESGLRVLVNRVDRTSIFPASAVAQLTSATVLEAKVPMSMRALEASINERDPRAVTEVAWWKLMTAIRQEIGLEEAHPSGPARGGSVRPARRVGRKKGGDTPLESAHGSPVGPTGGSPGRPTVGSPLAPGPRGPSGAPGSAPTSGPSSNGSGELEEATIPRAALTRAQSRQSGQIALENVVALPLALFIGLAAWQIVVIGLTFVFSSHAARVAAREFSVTGSTSQAQQAARDSAPWVFGNGLTVTSPGIGEITVTMHVPAAGPANLGFPQELTTTRDVVREQ